MCECVPHAAGNTQGCGNRPDSVDAPSSPVRRTVLSAAGSRLFLVRDLPAAAALAVRSPWGRRIREGRGAPFRFPGNPRVPLPPPGRLSICGRPRRSARVPSVPDRRQGRPASLPLPPCLRQGQTVSLFPRSLPRAFRYPVKILLEILTECAPDRYGSGEFRPGRDYGTGRSAHRHLLPGQPAHRGRTVLPEVIPRGSLRSV